MKHKVIIDSYAENVVVGKMRDHNAEFDEGIMSHNAASAILSVLFMVVLFIIVEVTNELGVSLRVTVGLISLYIAMCGYASWYIMSMKILNDRQSGYNSVSQFVKSVRMFMFN